MPCCSQNFIDSSKTDMACWWLGKSWNLLPNWLYSRV